jgi:DNA-binding NarL/FixJ family response regulator
MPLIIQVAFDAQLLSTREHLLKSEGFEVISCLGPKAFFALRPEQVHPAAAVVVGHAKDIDDREVLVSQIKTKYPDAKVIALRANEHRATIAEADENVVSDDPRELLAAVKQVASAGACLLLSSATLAASVLATLRSRG